jgi:hypothetical protein
MNEGIATDYELKPYLLNRSQSTNRPTQYIFRRAGVIILQEVGTDREFGEVSF